ncbi:MAG: AI-2E family transporter [Rheinheimera sp.]|nr:MAG: AI-2E family transporter [Rheinheimera sp.]
MRNIWSALLRSIHQAPQFLLLVHVLVMLGVTWFFADVLLPALLALAGAYVLERPVSWLQRLPMRRGDAVTLTMFLVIALWWWLLATLFPLVWLQAQAFWLALPELTATGRQYLDQLWSAQPGWLNERQLSLLLQRLEGQSLNFLNTLLASSLTGVAGVFYLLVYLVLLPMMMFFLLKDKTVLLAGLQQQFPASSTLLKPVWRQLDHQLLGYIQGKLLELVLLTLCCYLLFSLFALPYALLLALLVGLSVFIPYLGIAVVTVPVVLVTIGQWGLSSTSSWILFCYLLLQLLDAYVLVPWLFGRVVDINPFYIMLAVLVFGGLFGFWGVVLAIPLASLLKVLLQTFAPESG